MNWTAEQDGQLRVLHAKRVGVAVIGSWMRWPSSAVRARLVELGVAKPLSPRATSITQAAKVRKTAAAHPSATPRAVEPRRNTLDDEQDLKTNPGCPRGHLLSESQIAALYCA